MRRNKQVFRPHIKINGEHAMVRSISMAEAIKTMAPKSLSKSQKAKSIPRKKIIARRENNPVRAYGDAMTLAHLLFPKKFPKVSATKKERQTHFESITTYTQQVPLTRESQRAFNSYYNGNYGHYYKYESKYTNPIADEVKTKFERIGIQVNTRPMNVGINKHGFFYFEIVKINAPRLEAYINKLPEKTPSQRLKKKQAISLLQSIKVHQNEEGWVKTHYQPPVRNLL